MRRNKRVVESLAVLGLAGALTITAIPYSNVGEKEVESGFETNGIAGVTSALNNVQMDAYEEVGEVVTVTKVEVEMVASAKETTPVEPELSPEEQEWQDKLMTNIEDSLNVRENADVESMVVGKLRKGDLATIVEAGSEWTLISSGNVTGYVSNQYCVTGTDAMNYAKENCPTVATVNEDCLRLRADMTTEAEVVKVLAQGEVLTVDTDAVVEDGWTAISYNGTTCYVSSEFVTVGLHTTVGVTAEEEAAALAAAAAEKAAQERQQTVSYGAALAASTDDVTLLAALIEAECGSVYYDAQLAVGAVVCNRMKSGSYPSTLYDVIYQSGQFSPAYNGALSRWLQSGPSASSISAAQAALSGMDNTGGLLHFNAATSGKSGIVIGNMVFY